jgi:hypothetical protein
MKNHWLTIRLVFKSFLLSVLLLDTICFAIDGSDWAILFIVIDAFLIANILGDIEKLRGRA